MSTRVIALGVVGFFFAGGAYSFAKQGVPTYATVLLAVLAVLSLTGAVLWAV